MGDTLRERRSFDELEDEGVFLGAIDGGDVRVVERREHLRFATKPRETLRVRREILGQHFDRDVPSELGVTCEIDLTLYSRRHGSLSPQAHRRANGHGLA